MRLAVVLSLFVFLTSGASQTESDQLSSYKFTELDQKILEQVATRYEITDRRGDDYDVIVPYVKRREFLKLVPHAELVWQDIRDEFKNRVDSKGRIEGYRSFDEVAEYLTELADQYPEFINFSTYGESKQGRPLYVLKISDNVDVDEEEPELMLTSATHGDELITVEVLLGLIDQIVAGYNEGDERFSAMVEGTEMFFAPVVNPDGFVRQSRYANGVDPNREYPWPEKPIRRPVDCIAEQLKFYENRDFVGTMDFHASGEMIMFPWAYTYDPIETKFGELDELTKSMAEENNYRHGPISKVIYVAKGSSADYYFWQNEANAIAIEIGRSKIPRKEDIPRMIRDNSESTWRFIESFLN